MSLETIINTLGLELRTNMFPCCENRWVVCVSYGDGKTPIAAFPIKYYFEYTQKKGIYKEIFLRGLMSVFKLNSDENSYRLNTIPPGYGYNWEVLRPEVLEYTWYMLPEYDNQVIYSREDGVYYRIHKNSLQTSLNKDDWENAE